MIRTLCLFLALMPITLFGSESELQALLARIHQTGPAEFRYEETRTLELTSSPWQGQGNMLSGADGSLVKQQLQPTRVIMAIAGGRMYYWDSEQSQRHTAALGQSGQADELITVFIAILQGQAEQLKSTYDFVPENHGKHWTLRLTPKPGSGNEDAATIEISGDEDANKQQVLIRQPDGESTEYRMVKTSEGQELDKSIRRLLREAIGD
ncbi:MAG: outer membrane lipoprotein carrier protein LolA [Methylococcaceae bacterium]